MTNVFDSVFLPRGAWMNVAVYSNDTDEPDGYLRISRKEDGKIVSSWQPRDVEMPSDWTIWGAQIQQHLNNSLKESLERLEKEEEDDDDSGG